MGHWLYITYNNNGGISMTEKDKQPKKENTSEKPKKRPSTVNYVKNLVDKSKIKKR